jgi:hypothetical protein
MATVDATARDSGAQAALLERASEGADAPPYIRVTAPA